MDQVLRQISLGLAFTLIPLLAPVAQSWGKEKPPRVCTITINSREEIDVFQDVLSDQGFSFTELTHNESAYGKNDWFQKSCDSNVKCDVLVISGHFAGTFFGDSTYSLTTDQLEQAACDQRCKGVLNRPKEVFLFGCNTLNGKERDDITFDGYLGGLMTYGFTPAEAIRMAESKLGRWEMTVEDRMKSTFSQVSKIYGFSKIAPLGINVESNLKEYFKNTQDYQEHLDRVSSESGFRNTQLRMALKGTTYKEVEGKKIEEEKAEMAQLKCDMISKKSNPAEQMQALSQALVHSDLEELTSYVSKTLKRTPISKLGGKSKEIYKNIQINVEAKSNLQRLIDRAPSFFQKADLLAISLYFGWENVEGVRNQMKSTLLEKIKKDFKGIDGDLVCAMVESHPYLANLAVESDLRTDWMKWRQTGQAMACLTEPNSEIKQRLWKILKEGKNLEESKGALLAAGIWMGKERRVREKLKSIAINHADLKVQAAALRALRESKALRGKELEGFLPLVSDPESEIGSAASMLFPKYVDFSEEAQIKVIQLLIEADEKGALHRLFTLLGRNLKPTTRTKMEAFELLRHRHRLVRSSARNLILRWNYQSGALRDHVLRLRNSQHDSIARLANEVVEKQRLK